MAEQEEPQNKKARIEGSPVIGWFRNDLRLRDNPMLQAAIDAALQKEVPLMLIYILDQRFYDKSFYGRVTDPNFEKSIETRKPVDFASRKCDGRRTRFYLNVLRDVQRGLNELGTQLLVFHGKPEAVFATLQEQYGTLDVFCLREAISPEWTDVENFVEGVLQPNGSTLTRLWGASNLYDEDDLPFAVKDTPGSYSGLCYALGWEDLWTKADQWQGAPPIQQPIPAPSGPWQPKAFPEAPKSALAANALDDDREHLERMGFSKEEIDVTLKAPHGGSRKGKGGETTAWTRFKAWMEQDPKAEAKNDQFVSLSGDFGAGYADYIEDGAIDSHQWKNLSKPLGWLQLSKYMACGCITPREMYHTLIQGDKPHWATAGVLHRFMWREWHRLNAIKYHRKLVWLQGPGRQNMVWKHNPEAAEQWKKGQTGIPLIDAYMRELNETGWLAYKGRKSAATFLAHDLWIDWRIGAFHMEEVLLDYDYAMNYGNWTFCARVDKKYDGSDWRDPEHWGLRKNIKTEAANDPDATYIKQWVPELRGVDQKYIYNPWMMSEEEAVAANCVLGKDYPRPLIKEKKLQFFAHEKDVPASDMQPGAWNMATENSDKMATEKAENMATDNSETAMK